MISIDSLDVRVQTHKGVENIFSPRAIGGQDNSLARQFLYARGLESVRENRVLLGNHFVNPFNYGQKQVDRFGLRQFGLISLLPSYNFYQD